MPIILPSRPVAGGFNELAKCRHGVMLFNSNDIYIGKSLRNYGEYSKGEMDLFRKIVQKNMVVVEGGANIGAHTVGLSQMLGPAGRLYAFEPQRIVFQTLCANLALNSCANVYAYQAALGAHGGNTLVPDLSPETPNNFGGFSLRDQSHGERTPLRTIDELGLTACNLLKLDIEGMEVEALKGASRTVQTCRPTIFVENDRRDRSEELLSLLMSWDYRPYWHITPLFSEDNFNLKPKNIFGDTSSFNLLCLPREGNLTVSDAEEITSPVTAWPGRF